MRKKNIFIISFVLLFVFSAFKSYEIIIDEYEVSAVEDLSFEERLIYHDPEITALDNYYTEVIEKPVVVSDYNSIMTDFSTVIYQQKQYMLDNNITFEQIRANPSLLPINFTITDAQMAKIQNIVNETRIVASPELEVSLNSLEEYTSLAREVEYTQLEIYKDVTGKELILEPALHENRTTQVKGKNSVFNALYKNAIKPENKDKRGLQSKESIRKLKDLLKNKLAKEGSVSIYPNPLNEDSKVSFYNTNPGDVTYTVYDLHGRAVSTKTQKEKQGAVTINSLNIVKDNLSSGIYILNIKVNKGAELSQKFIIK